MTVLPAACLSCNSHKKTLLGLVYYVFQTLQRKIQYVNAYKYLLVLKPAFISTLLLIYAFCQIL